VSRVGSGNAWDQENVAPVSKKGKTEKRHSMSQKAKASVGDGASSEAAAVSTAVATEPAAPAAPAAHAAHASLGAAPEALSPKSSWVKRIRQFWGVSEAVPEAAVFQETSKERKRLVSQIILLSEKAKVRAY
jgi:hypothetical protein